MVHIERVAHEVAVAGFLSRYPTPYVRRHITVNKMCYLKYDVKLKKMSFLPRITTESTSISNHKCITTSFYIYIHTHACTYARTQTYTHTHTQTHTQTHTHTDIYIYHLKPHYKSTENSVINEMRRCRFNDPLNTFYL